MELGRFEHEDPLFIIYDEHCGDSLGASSTTYGEDRSAFLGWVAIDCPQ